MAIDPNISDFISQAVSKYGLDPNQTIDVTDPLTRLSMAVIITNIEQGRDIYSYDQFVKGSAMSSGVDPDTYNTLVNAVSLGFENFQAAGGFVSPALPSISSGGSSVPTNYSQYAQAAEIVAKVSSSSIDSIISSTQAILAVNAMNLPNPLTGGISAPTSTDNPLSNMFSGIFQKLGLTGGASTTIQNAAQQAADAASSAVRAAGGTAQQAADAARNAAEGIISRGSSAINGAIPASGTPDVATVGDSLGVGIVAASPNTLGDKNPNAAYDVLEGRTAAQTLSVVKSDTDLQGTTNAVISVGSNDAANGVNPAAFTSQIQQIRSTMNSDSYTWVLPAFSEKTAPYINAIKTLAAQNGDKVIQAVAGSPATDIYHPSGTGYNNLGTEIGKNLVDTSEVTNPTYTSPTRGISTTQTTTDAAKSAEQTAINNGYTIKTPIADAEGNQVGTVYTNPITKQPLVFNNLSGTLKDSAGQQIKTSNDLMPGLDTVLKDQGYTYAVPNANGSITYTKQPESTESPPDLRNSVTIDTNGNTTFNGGARYNVGATFAGLQLDAAGIKQISDTAATTPIFGGSTPSASLFTTAGTISANYGSITTLGVGAAINESFGKGVSVTGGTMAQLQLVNYSLAQGQAASDLAQYQKTYDNNTQLLSDYQNRINVNDNQLATVKATLNELQTTQLDNAKLAQTDALLKESDNLRSLNNTAQGLENKIEQLNSNITNSTDADLIKGWEAEKQTAANQKNEILQKIEESNQRLNDISSGKIAVDDNGATVASLQAQIAAAKSEIDLLTTNKIDLNSDAAKIRFDRDKNLEAIAGIQAVQQNATTQIGLPQKISDLNQQITDQSNYIKALSTNTGIPDRETKLQEAKDTFNTLVNQRAEAIAQSPDFQGPQTPAGWVPGRLPNTLNDVSGSNVLVAYEANNTNAAIAISLQGSNGQLAYDSSTGNYYLNGYQTDSSGVRVSDVPNTATLIGTPVDSVDTARLLSETVPGEIYYSTTDKGTTYYKDGEIVNSNGDTLNEITTGDPVGGDYSQIPDGPTQIDYITAQITPSEPAFDSYGDTPANIEFDI